MQLQDNNIQQVPWKTKLYKNPLQKKFYSSIRSKKPATNLNYFPTFHKEKQNIW